jgi:hypothetical protein
MVYNKCVLFQVHKQANEERSHVNSVLASKVKQLMEELENQRAQLREQDQSKIESNNMSRKVLQLQEELTGIQGICCCT